MITWNNQKLNNMCTTHLQNAINYISSNYKPNNMVYGNRADKIVKEMSIIVGNRQIKQIEKYQNELRLKNQALLKEFNEYEVMKNEIKITILKFNK